MQLTLKTAEQTFEFMRERLGSVIPEIELRHKSELVYEINELKRQKDAIILGHNYMEPALYHMVADFTGDSLELARKATQVEQSSIVFCGVHFMAETAKILNPSKRVLIPSDRAGCSLASSITAEDVRAVRVEFPNIPVVTYVNSTAAVKAESDACCTSGNAVEIVKSFGTDSIIFLPDEYLAKNVAKETGKDIIFPIKSGGSAKPSDFKQSMISWHGKCEVHEQFTVQDIKDIRRQYPDVVVLAHPECSPDVTAASDFAGSTKRMIDYVSQTNAPRYLILTECAMGDNIIAANPQKEVLRMCSVRCPHMNQISLEQTKRCLEQGTFEVEVAEPIRSKAKAALDYMLLH
jgi:quinolinate synthase